MSRRNPPDDDLEDLLADLETTLEELRRELRPARRRPPTPGEIIRFTEEYSIPTIIAVLETTIRSLELLRQVLRLADPARSARGEARSVRNRLGPAVEDASDQAFERLDRSLSDLRAALAETDLPADDGSRSIIEDARELTAEIDRRIAGSDRRSDRDVLGVDTGRRRTGSITIPVDEETADEDSEDDGDRWDDDDDHGDDPITVDIEAELESIRREVSGGDVGPDVGDDADESGADAEKTDADGTDADDSTDEEDGTDDGTANENATVEKKADAGDDAPANSG